MHVNCGCCVAFWGFMVQWKPHLSPVKCPFLNKSFFFYLYKPCYVKIIPDCLWNFLLFEMCVNCRFKVRTLWQEIELWKLRKIVMLSHVSFVCSLNFLTIDKLIEKTRKCLKFSTKIFRQKLKTENFAA